MPKQQNVNSPAKSISDYQLTYDRLTRMRSDLEEIIRLGQLSDVDHAPDQESLDTVDSWILEIRSNMKFSS